MLPRRLCMLLRAVACCVVQAQMVAVEQQLLAFKAAMDAGESAASKLQVKHSWVASSCFNG